MKRSKNAIVSNQSAATAVKTPPTTPATMSTTANALAPMRRDAAADTTIASPLVSRKRKEIEDPALTTGNGRVFKRADFPRVNDRRQALMVQTRREMVEKLEDVGRDKSRDFNTRVNAARAAAIADVLFESAITLPTADEISALLYTYKTQVEPFVNVVVIDINIARIQSFLRWWHSKPTTMPTDPPLVPLLLVILALTLQVKRNSPEFEGHNLRNFVPIPGVECSDERTLLSVAGHCIDALQIACPSAWSSAFQAPIDLTKASLLRGIWHLNELNLQFAGTCFALTTRLAHAAGLHRDPEHWSGMRIEEAQARRNLWWNIVFFEVAHAHRIGQPPCFDARRLRYPIPDDYDALYAMYERAGLADPDPSRIILPPGATALVPRVPSHTNFDYHWSRFRIYHIFLRQSQQLFRFGISSPPDPNLNDEYAKWRENLPERLKLHFERRAKGSVRPSDELLAQVAAQSFDNRVYDPKITDELQDYQQGYSLEFMYHQCMITLHRPYIDEQGAWKPPESVQKSLEVCLQSAEALINTVEDVLATLPANSMYNQCAYFAFNAGLILAIHCKLDPSSQVHRPHLQKALDLLSTLSSMARLTNVAEQAGRYSSTLKQMLHGIGGDIANLAATKPTGTASTSAAERQNGESNGDVAAAVSSEGRGDASDSREGAIIGALDPSLGGGEEARDVSDANARTDVDGGPDRIPAFLLPFVGLPTDPNHLGPQTGNSFWSESLLDRPLVGVPVAYPVGFGQGILSQSEQQNGSSWASTQQQEGGMHVNAESGHDAGAAILKPRTGSRSGGPRTRPGAHASLVTAIPKVTKQLQKLTICTSFLEVANFTPTCLTDRCRFRSTTTIKNQHEAIKPLPHLIAPTFKTLWRERTSSSSNNSKRVVLREEQTRHHPERTASAPPPIKIPCRAKALLTPSPQQLLPLQRQKASKAKQEKEREWMRKETIWRECGMRGKTFHRCSTTVSEPKPIS